jgi:MoaA/NifB/PqqE/SkfB family radical SAM enzyme
MRANSARPPSEMRHPPAVEQDKLAMGLSLLHLANRGLAEGRIGPNALRALLRTLLYDVLVRHGDVRAKDRFAARHGCNPPDFLTISPGKACNLKCVGCYANSGPAKEKLDWATFDRVVSDAHRDWGSRFFVLTGGEPLAYKDEGKGVLELAERHPDCFFIMYTNGTLIDDRVARRMGELGNLSPALSVEGLKERTDARRGDGVYDRILAAMQRLRREKVLFGISLTATRENAEEILSDAVVETFFEKLGVLYAFVFHYMPIGREFGFDLMMTPEQRFRLLERSWSLIRERHLFIADFWNGGTAVNGCVAAGRTGGYLHVNWNGDVSPCVFVPYSPVNIADVYARGGSLEEVWTQPFFTSIRRWQRDYGYRRTEERCPERCDNWLAPCIIRDHHAEFQKMVEEHHPKPTDDDAKAALEDPSYHERLVEFDRQFAAITDPVWEAKYRRSPGTPPPPLVHR